MPSGLADYGSNTWLSALFGLTPLPPSYYVALTTLEPGDAMDGDILADLEPTSPSYRRQRIGIGPASWEAADNYVVSTVDVDFGVAAGDWGLVSHYVLCTQPTGGELFAWGELLNPTYVQDGFYVTVPAGGLVVALSALDPAIAV